MRNFESAAVYICSDVVRAASALPNRAISVKLHRREAIDFSSIDSSTPGSIELLLEHVSELDRDPLQG